MSTDQKPQDQPSPIGQPNSKAVQTNIETRVKELVNVNRIVANAIAVISDATIKGGHSNAVAEVLGWLTGFGQSLTTQTKTLEATLPKKAEEKPTAPEPTPLVAAGKGEVPVKQEEKNTVEPVAKASAPVERKGGKDSTYFKREYLAQPIVEEKPQGGAPTK